MKKKVSIIVTAAALVALIVVGSTLAFFTSQGTVNNVITMGDVKISLTEPNFKDSGAVPGKTIAKDPTVKNIGSHEAYIRCKLDIIVPDAGNVDATATRKMQLLEGIDIDRNLWAAASDGYYYYQGKLAPGESVKFFNNVKIPETWDNDLAGKNFHINVSAEAIQTDNFTPAKTGDKITGWNYSDGSAVSMESSSAASFTPVAQ